MDRGERWSNVCRLTTPSRVKESFSGAKRPEILFWLNCDVSVDRGETSGNLSHSGYFSALPPPDWSAIPKGSAAPPPWLISHPKGQRRSHPLTDEQICINCLIWRRHTIEIQTKTRIGPPHTSAPTLLETKKTMSGGPKWRIEKGRTKQKNEVFYGGSGRSKSYSIVT